MSREPLSISDFYNLESGIATEFRRLLHNLQNLAKDREIKTLLVTSSMLSEGKSTVCAFLAMTAARKGLKTLLIDCDLRRPTMHKLFAAQREPGLAEILENGVLAKTAIRKTSLDKLDLITAGKACAIPAEVFDASAIGRLATEMKFYYDLIILDAAPVIPVSDPMLLSQEVDGVIFVVKAGATQRDVVGRATGILAASTNRILGVVLNNSEGTLPFYYSHDYYGYDYKQPPGADKVSGKSRSEGEGSSGARNGQGKKAEAKQKNTSPQ
jgi:capsular exopolysaccharide synthesis family protein